MTPAVARLYEAINAERVAVAAAVGASVPTLADWFERVYGVRGATLVETCQQLTYNSAGPYQATGTPKSLDHKFITEDLPTGLIPMSALGAEAGTTPANHEMVSSSAILFPFTSARAVTTPAALYWRSRAQPPTSIRRGRSARAHVSPRCFKHRKWHSSSRRSPRLASLPQSNQAPTRGTRKWQAKSQAP